ncbi:MAG: hypothetical protein AB8B56_06445 [Crocinitomicaceae bacterium]
MKHLLLIFALSLCSLSLFGQIWNYPPKALTTYEEFSEFKMDHVRTFRAWKREQTKEGFLGEFEQNLTEEFDSLGRVVLRIKKEDTVRFIKFINGYWAEGILNDERFTQKLKVDENDNVIYRKYGAQIDSVIYDDLNRPLERHSKYESCFWNYENGLLSSFTKENEGKVFEETKYFHDTVHSTLSYTTCHFLTIAGSGKSYKQSDSIFAQLNEQGEPIFIEQIDNSSSVRNTLVMTVEYDENGNVVGGLFGCQRVEFVYNELGYRMYSRRYDCDGELIFEEKFDYEFFD